MASSEFSSKAVIKMCERALESLKKDIEARHQESIKELMRVPRQGFWPFARIWYMSREEAERDYELFNPEARTHSQRWWDERPYRQEMSAVRRIMDLAKETESATILLSDSELALLKGELE